MLRTPTVRKLFTLCLLSMSALAVAQQQQAPTPPNVEIIEDTPNTKDDGRIGAAPAAPKPEAARITEKKEGGRVTEVRVKSGKSEYTMKPNVPAGNAQPGDAQSSAIRPPQWTVLEFDLNKRKKRAAEAAEAADAPPPDTTGKGAAKPAPAAKK